MTVYVCVCVACRPVLLTSSVVCVSDRRGLLVGAPAERALLVEHAGDPGGQLHLLQQVMVTNPSV